MGSFGKSLKIKTTITYMRFAELEYYQRRFERLFELILVFQGGFGVRYIRVFCEFPIMNHYCGS